MNHTVSHPALRMDPDLRDFLTLETELPKSSNTSALSAAGVMRLFGKVGDAVTKMSSSLQETDTVSQTTLPTSFSLDLGILALSHAAPSLLVAPRLSL